MPPAAPVVSAPSSAKLGETFVASVASHAGSTYAWTVVGGSIGLFYSNPQEALARLKGLTAPTSARMMLGGRTYDVLTSPIVDAQDSHPCWSVLSTRAIAKCASW